MSQPAAKQSANLVEPAEVRQSLEKILDSKHFVHAPKKKGFLKLICDFYLQGRAHELNEYILGYDVFDRDQTYDPAADPVVRVTAHEIRKKLELYYQSEGASDAVRLDIPPGSYQPTFTRHSDEAQLVDASSTTGIHSSVETTLTQAEPAGKPRLPLARVLLSITVMVLAIAVVILSISNYDLRRKAPGSEVSIDPAMFEAVWAPFMENGATPLVVLSNPPALRLSNASDTEVLTRESIPLPPDAVARLKDRLVTNPEVVIKQSSGGVQGNASEPQAAVIKQIQSPRLIISTDVFTGVGEAIGLHYLTDLFRSAGKGIILKQSRTLSAEDLKNHNVIVLGGIWVNEWSGKLAQAEDFIFTGKATIQNLNPQPGEEATYISQFDSRTGSLIVDYALITVKPNISADNSVMTLAGAYSQGTEAAAEFVTNKNYLNQLNQRLKELDPAGGPPRYYQALLKVNVENGIPTTISILALHSLAESEP